MLEKIAHHLTRKPKRVILIAVLMLIPSVLGAALTRINYDILSYIPQDMDSAKGEALLEDPFQMAATTMLIVEGMPPEYTHQLQQQVGVLRRHPLHNEHGGGRHLEGVLQQGLPLGGVHEIGRAHV